MFVANTLGVALLSMWLDLEVESRAVTAMRAAFVYNLIRFSTWPADFKPGTDGPTICTIGAGGVSDALTAMVAPPASGVRTFSVRRLEAGADVHRCHVLYVSGGAAADATKVVDTVKDLPVLTVGESQAFIQAGGIASLFPEKESLRIAVNSSAVRRSRLQLSSRVLSLARVINGEPTTRR